MPVLTCRRVMFYSPGDEMSFFEWFGKIKAIRKVVGSGDAILLHVPSKLSDKGLRELLAVFHRYRINMERLAQFESVANRKWFTDPRKYWHKLVFPPTAVK